MPAKDAALAAVELAIFDNDQCFSFVRSPFRRVEYAAHIHAFSRAAIYSTYAERHGPDGTCPESAELRPYIFPLAAALEAPPPQLAYTVFLSNASYFLPWFERHRIPFCFTLYPGGAFFLNDAGSDLRLLRILSSPYFRKVIVTQHVTRQYLLERGLCRPDQVEFIWGCALPVEDLTRAAVPRRYYLTDKPTLDVGFVAFKYSEGGRDKGFDVFAKCAARLVANLPSVRFHVVGNFGPSDLPPDVPRDKMTFYGPRPTSFFPSFYSGIDLILAPTRAFVLAPGAFDGFPTGACTEAAVCGVPVFCSDPLQMNDRFQHGKELVIIEPDPASASEAILRHCKNPENLRWLGENGRAAVLRHFHPEVQLAPRTRLLRECLASRTAPESRTGGDRLGLEWLDRENERRLRLEGQLGSKSANCVRCRQIEESRSWKLVLGLRRLKRLFHGSLSAG